MKVGDYINIQLNRNLTWDNLILNNSVKSSSTLLEQDSYLLKNDVNIDSTSTPFDINALGIEASYVNSILLDDTRIIMIYSSSGVASISLITYNEVSELWELTSTQAINSKVNVSQNIQIVKYNSNKIIVAYSWNDSNIGKISVLHINNSSDSCFLLESGGSFLKESGGSFLTTLDFLFETSSFIFEAEELSNIALCLFDSYILVCYVKVNNFSNCGITKLLSIDSDYTITEVEDAEYIYDTGDSDLNNTKLINIDTERCILSYIDNDDSHVLKIIQKDSDNNITFTNKTYTEGDTTSTINTIFQIDTTKFIISYYDSTLLLFKIADISDNQIILSDSHSTSLVVNYVSVCKAYSTSTKENVYWFIATYSTSTDTYAQAFMIEKQTFYEGGVDSISTSYDYLSCLVNSDNVGFLAYKDTTDTYGYFRKLEDIAITTNRYPRKGFWQTNVTKLLCNFDSDLEGGNINGEIASWKLTRREEDDFLYETIGTYSGDTTEYVDNKVKNNIEYTYLVSAIDSEGNQSGAVSSTGEVSFSGFMISDESYFYNLDIGWDGYQTSDINTNKGSHKFDNLTQYPVVAFGAQNYRTGTITCIPYSLNTTTNTYDINLEVLNNFKSFLDNGSEKWLRTQDGDILKIYTKNTSYKYNDKILDQPYQIKFEWCEIGDV